MADGLQRRARPWHAHGGHDDHDESHEGEISLTAAAIEHHGITLGQAEQRELRETFSAPARLAYNEDALAHVGTLVSGRVSRLAKGVGDPVAAADLLLVIDSAELGSAQNDHLAKLAELAAAATAFQIAEQYFQSGKDLSAAEAVSRADVQQREVALGVAEAKFKSAQAGLSSGRNRLQLFGMTQPDIARLEETGVIRPQAEIRAPIAGTVVERGITLGETVNSEQSHLFVVADLRQLWLLVEVPPAQAAALKVGQSVTLTDPATGRIATAALDYVSPVASPGARTIRVRAVVDNPDGSWRPGMFVTAKLPTRAEAARSVAVPAEGRAGHRRAAGGVRAGTGRGEHVRGARGGGRPGDRWVEAGEERLGGRRGIRGSRRFPAQGRVGQVNGRARPLALKGSPHD